MTFIYTYTKEVTEVYLKNIDSTKVLNYTPETKKNKIDNEISKKPNEKHIVKVNNFDSQIRMLNWKLQKNIETLLFLKELESRYKNNNKISSVVKDYYDLKREVQKSTIEITRKLSYYRLINKECA